MESLPGLAEQTWEGFSRRKSVYLLQMYTARVVEHKDNVSPGRKAIIVRLGSAGSVWLGGTEL